MEGYQFGEYPFYKCFLTKIGGIYCSKSVCLALDLTFQKNETALGVYTGIIEQEEQFL